MNQPQKDNFLEKLDSLKRSKSRLWIPGMARSRIATYESMFQANTSRNLFRGVYDTYEAAAQSAPKNRAQGYDNAESAAIYFGHMSPDAYDYPAMLWLERSFAGGSRSVFDVGGHIGIKFYAFKQILQYPTQLKWTVCDVPAVTARGQAVAAKRDPTGQLQFTNNYSAVNGSDILFASGVLQYLPMTIQQWLTPVQHKPRRIIFNTTAIHPDKSFFTVNSIGTAYCPYRITSEADFFSQMSTLGYSKIDQWRTPGKGAMHLPLETDHDIPEYSGFVFDLVPS
jgi:putative methyltransferase (TIGR04325 family)